MSTAKPSELSQQLGGKAQEVLKLVKKGHLAGEIAEMMGIGKNSVEGHVSILRKKGFLPHVRGEHVGKLVRTEPSLEEKRLAREQTGLAFQQAQKIEHVKEAKVPRGKRRPMSNTKLVAQMLDDEIHKYVQEGNRLGPIHRMALVLIEEILKQ